MTLDKSGRTVRAMFENIAARYDLLNHLLSANQDKRWRRSAIGRLAPQPGEKVLDLCCGTGDLAFEIIRQQPCCHVLGADFALPMLGIAQAKAQSLGAVPFLAGDALGLPFGDARFEAAAVAFGVRNFEDTMAGLIELRRVVKPGGRLLVLEFMRPSGWPLRFGFGLFFKRVLPLVGRLVSRHCSAYNYLPASVDEFYSVVEFEALLKRAGWTQIQSADLGMGIATSFIACRPTGLL